jgi:polysaccharide export outer membrane protein
VEGPPGWVPGAPGVALLRARLTPSYILRPAPLFDFVVSYWSFVPTAGLPRLVAIVVWIAIAVAALPPALLAQLTSIPPDQARRLLDARPDVEAQLRRELTTSGLTPDQIRARLRAIGYPETLLDSYMSSRPPARAQGSVLLPSDDVVEAVAALGIIDSAETSGMRDALRRRRAQILAGDTLRLGRIGTGDSLGLLDTLGVLDVPAARGAFDSLGRPTVARLASSRPPARVDSGFAIFGLNIFNTATTQFDPNLSGPVDASYKIGAGDRLVLFITGDAERAYTLDVTREGFVIIPGVGDVQVANLTLAQLEDVLYPRLGRVFSGLRRGAGATTRFSITVARTHTNQIFVLGDVDQPGSYRISSAATALAALYAAGGPTQNGSLRRVEIRRRGRTIDTLDVYDYLLRADGSHDPRLETGDIVFVPVRGSRVRVFGEVVRPGTYELRRGETLADLVRAAGGFTAEAARRRLQLSRILPPSERDTSDRGRVVIDVGADRLAPDDAPSFPLENGDVVRVFAVNDRVGRRVAVRGDVWSPGVVGFTPGMRLSDAIRMAGGIKPDAYLDHVLISRLRPADSARVQLRAALLDSTGRPVADIALQEDDEIRVFSVTELRPAPFVAITGAVRRPGRYLYREGMTMRDLVLLAGGLDGRAHVGEAEIARAPTSRDGGRLAVAQRVPLDSSYLFVGEPGRRRSSSSSDVVLQASDNVLVFAQPEWTAPRRVVVTGEVRLPGSYTLVKKDERLSDIIERAGGVTGAAFTGGIVFYRNRGGLGRVGVDLPRVLREPGYRDNLLVLDGDSIHVPQYNGVVEVQGAVNAPRGVTYVPGASFEYYVHAAGGTTPDADVARSYVTQPDGRVESVVVRRFRSDVVPVPQPGSVVQITQRKTPERTDVVARLGVFAQILGGLVALVAVTRR